MTWTGNGPQEYADLEMMQMLGRAGRPQFESSACAAILTRDDKIRRYDRMVSGEELLESSLHLNLIEHLNAEIGLGTVFDVPSAKRWLSGTFLFVRDAKPISTQGWFCNGALVHSQLVARWNSRHPDPLGPSSLAALGYEPRQRRLRLEPF